MYNPGETSACLTWSTPLSNDRNFRSIAILGAPNPYLGGPETLRHGSCLAILRPTICLHLSGGLAVDAWFRFLVWRRLGRGGARAEVMLTDQRVCRSSFANPTSISRFHGAPNDCHLATGQTHNGNTPRDPARGVHPSLNEFAITHHAPPACETYRAEA